MLGAVGCAVTPEALSEQAKQAIKDRNNARALEIANQGVRRWTTPGISDRFRLIRAEALIRLSRHDEALTELATIRKNREYSFEPNLEARLLYLEALQAGFKQPPDYDRCNRLLDLAKQNEMDAATFLDVLNLQGYAHQETRAYDRAISCYRELYLHAAAPELKGKAQVNIGFCHAKLWRDLEAIDALLEAEKLLPADTKDQAILSTNLGMCYGRLGYYERGHEYLDRAIEIYTKLGEDRELSDPLGEKGNLYFYEGRYDKAETQYALAYERAIQDEKNANAAIWAGNLAAICIKTEEWVRAEQWNDEARNLRDDAELYPILNQAFIQMGHGRFSEAETLFEQVRKAVIIGAQSSLTISNAPKPERAQFSTLPWQVYAGLGNLYYRQDQWPKAKQYYAMALEEIDKITLQGGYEVRFRFFDRMIGFYHDYVDALVKKGAKEMALRLVESSRARILSEQFSPTSGLKPSLLSQEALRRIAREKGIYLLTYWLGPKHSYRWLFPPSGNEPSFKELAPESEIRRLVMSYLDFIRGANDPFAARNDGHALREILLQGIPLFEKNARILLVPDGVLFNLNFETLPMEDNRYWIEDVILSVSPSFSLTFRERPPPNPSGEIFLIGDPCKVETEFPELAYASREINAIRNRLVGKPQMVKVREQASPEAFIDTPLHQYQFINIVAHAAISRGKPLDSAVILSRNKKDANYRLLVRDILDLRLGAELVTISSCTSAGSRVFAGEGLMGFAWAFQFAGAHNVVAGLWNVNGKATSILMDRFYAKIAAGMAPDKALREAKLDLLKENNYRFPYYWAPFQVYR